MNDQPSALDHLDAAELAGLPPLRVQVLRGQEQGRTVQFDRGPITFGRSPDNRLVIEDPLVSRLHGELLIEDGRWVLANHSTNGCEINGKKVRQKPRPLPAAGMITIAGVALLQTSLHQPDAEQAGYLDNASPNAANRKSRRKLWIGISVYLLLMVGIGVFFATLDDSGNDDASNPSLQPLTADEIANLIAEDKPILDPDPNAYRQNLREARKLYAESNAYVNRTDIAYRAYAAYRTAKAYNNNTLDEPQDVDQHAQLRQTLTQRVTEQYDEAYRRFRTQQWEEARRAFDELRDNYFSDTSSGVYINAGRFRAEAQRRYIASQ